MFNLRSDLKIYTCDKYVGVKKVIDIAQVNGAFYTFQVSARIEKRGANRYGREQEFIRFSPIGVGENVFRDAIYKVAGFHDYELESSENFHRWAKANPDKTWRDFLNGTQVNLSLNKDKIDNALNKLRPDARMNALALSPESEIAGLIGKKGRMASRRRSKDERENQLLCLWVLFGVEVAISASRSDLDSIVDGVALHDFGLTHCEHMESIINYVRENLKVSFDVAKLATPIKELDSMLKRHGGKTIERSRPRSPFFRQLYDSIYGFQAA